MLENPDDHVLDFMCLHIDHPDAKKFSKTNARKMDSKAQVLSSCLQYRAWNERFCTDLPVRD